MLPAVLAAAFMVPAFAVAFVLAVLELADDGRNYVARHAKPARWATLRALLS